MSGEDEFGQRREMLRIQRDRWYRMQDAAVEMDGEEVVEAIEAKLEELIWEIYKG